MLTLDKLISLIDQTKIKTIQIKLDDLVHDCAQNDETIETYDAQGDEIYDLRSLWASELNNQGWHEQIAYILSQGADNALITILITIAKSGHEKIKLYDLI